VTFLFTDLAGSTKLLEAHPNAYREAVRRHHALLREAVEGHGGRCSRRRGTPSPPPSPAPRTRFREGLATGRAADYDVSAADREALTLTEQAVSQLPVAWWHVTTPDQREEQGPLITSVPKKEIPPRQAGVRMQQLWERRA
jgi:hypothetical protein